MGKEILFVLLLLLSILVFIIGRNPRRLQPQMYEIYDHMTSKEKRKGAIRAGLYGLFLGITFAAPLSCFLIGTSILSGGSVATLITIYILGSFLFLQDFKKFLSYTEWARSRGYKAENIKIFDFQNILNR